MKLKISIAFALTGLLLYADMDKKKNDSGSSVSNKKELVNIKAFQISPNWITPKILDKDFWHIVNTGKANSFPQYRNSSIKNESMIREAGFLWHNCSTIGKKPSSFSDLTLETIEIYGPMDKRNLAVDSTPNRYIEGTDNLLPSCPSLSYDTLNVTRDIQKGYFTLTFKRPEKLNRILVKSSDCEYLPSSFSLEYRIAKNKWEKIPSLIKNGNNLTFPVLTTEAIRFSIQDGNDPGVQTIDLIEEGLNTAATGINLNKVPFFIFSNPHYSEYGIFRSTLPYKYFKIDKEAYRKWKEKHKFAFFRFFPGEWGCDFYICANWDGQWSKSPRKFRQENKINVIIPKPQNREEALGYVRDYYEKRKKVWFDDLFDFTNMVPWNHYQLEWGSTETGMETTAYGDPSHQAQVAFCRGAARQYHCLWGWYLAYFWDAGASPTSIYSPGKVGKHARMPSGGISISLAKRDMYLAYLSGAAFLTHEQWPDAFFQPSVKDDYKSTWKLSAHGEALKEWFAFTQKNPDRGISYTPIALLLDYYHGWSITKPIWFYWSPEQKDNMITSFMYTLFPWIPDRPDNDTRLFNSPYGDIYDALIANPPSGKMDLSPYKVAVLLGDVQPDKVLAAKLHDYVQKGGTLVINAKQVTPEILPNFLGLSLSGKSVVCGKKLQSILDAESIALSGNYNCAAVKLDTAKAILADENKTPVMTINDYGKGKVIFTTPDWMLEKDLKDARKKSPLAEFLLKRIVPEVLPFKIEGDIEYGLNKLDDGWLVYLINNKGVHKQPTEAATFDMKETSTVKLGFGTKPAKIVELRENKEIPVAESISVDVPPGDIKILKIIEK